MKIAFNPSTVAALTTPPNNKDITFDLRGRNIFARGVKFCGTDTWRDIKINNVSIGSNILDLRNGSNTTLTNTNGVVTINSTWRPVVDNLTSDSTTSSLSAKQGKILKSLIDGKSNSGHTHDDRYLKLTGGTMASNALITFADSGSWGTDKGPQGARGGLYWTGQSDYAKLYAEETVGDNLDLVIQFGDDNSNGLSIRNKANTQTSYISAGGVITTGTFKGNLDWSYITNKPTTATRWPSWAEVTGKPSSFTPSTHTHGLSNSVFFLNIPNISGNAKWKEVFGYPVNYNLLLSVRINNPAPEWCVGNFGSGILYGGSDTKGFMSSAYNEPLIMWAGGNGSSDDSVPKWYIGIKGIHKSIYNLATIASEANSAYNLRHSHSNKSVLDGITSGLVNNWNIAYTFVNTITGTDTDKVINKWDEIVNFLAGITEDNKLNTLLNSKLSVYKLADNTNVGAIKNNGIYYSTTDASSGTLTNSPFNTGFALINMTSLDNGDDLRRSRLAFNAYGEIKVSNDRDLANTAETWYNVLTSKNSGISGSTIKLNGTSITVYSSDTTDGRYVKKSGDTMRGALNFANGTWNLVGDDSYMGDCNISGHFGIKAANTTYPGIAFFNNANAHLGNLTAYSSNIKYRAYSLQFLDNGNTSVSASTWTNPFSSYNSNAVADGQAICVWGLSSYLGNLANDTGDMSLWLKRVNDKVVTLNMVLDGEYYANGNLRLAHVSEIPNSLKNPYSLTTFGVVYDGSAAKVVGPSNFISLVTEGTSTVTDGTMFITSYASNSGFADTNAVNVPYKRKAIHLWEYIKAKTDSIYAAKSHNHDDRYVRAFGTSNDNIDSDWGLSFKTFDPIPSGTPPELNPNISLLSIGNNFNRRKLLAFIYNNDNIYYRRHVDGSFTNWRRLAFANEIPISLKNPYALTISLNGTSQGPYDGSAAKNINITPGSIGAATSNHTHPYLPLSGGTVTGNIILKGGTSADMTYAGNVHPYIRFDNSDSSLNISLIFTDYDSYRRPAGIKLVGNQGNEWFEAANIYATTFYGALSGNASSATKLLTARSLWGNMFDGTGNVSGFMKNVTGLIHGNNIGDDWSDGNNTHPWYGIDYRHCVDSSETGKAYTSISSYFGLYFKTGGSRFIFDGGNVGIGTNAPAYKLHVNGTFRAANSTVSDLFVNTGDATLKIYTGRTADALNDGNICFLTSIDATDGQSHAYPTLYLNRCNIVLQPRGGLVYIGTNPGTGNTTYKLYVNSKIFSNGGFVKNGSSDSYVLLGGGGHKAISDFATSSHTHDDRYYTKAESNAKYITDITTSVNKLTFTKNGSNITRDIRVNNVLSLGRRNPLTERNAISGIYTYGTYSDTDNLAPSSYFETLGFGEGAGGTIEIGGSWISGGKLYWRALRDCCEDWFSWKTILDSSNYSGILDSRYYTESEVNNLLSNKLNTSDFNWTNLPDKLVAGNEFNIVNAGFNADIWFNYKPINDSSKTASIHTYIMGNGAKGMASVTASGFIKNGSNSNYVLLGNGGHKAISDFATSNHNHNYLRGHRLGYRHLDAGPKSSWSDSRLYIGYNGFDDDDGVTNSIGFYRSTGTGTYTRTLWAEINSNGLWASNRFGVNGQNTGYNFYVNGTSLLNNVVRIQYNTPNLYIRNTVDTSYSIIRFGTNSNENASYIFQNGPSRTDDGGANTMTIRNNVGYLRLDNSTSVTGLLTVSSGSTHKGIKIGNNYINAINGELIIQNNTAIRFGNDSWDYNVWAGLKYNHTAKTIYLGLADGSVFNANSALSGGSLRFPGISNVYATTFNGSLSGNASTATNADKLDGTHLNGIFTAFGNNAHNITATIGGVTKSFLVNWAADSDKLDGYHENSFLRYRGDTSTDLEATLWNLIGIKLYNNALPDNLTGVYNYGSVISLPGSSSRFEIYASHLSSNGNGLYYRSGWGSDKKTWLKFIDSSNIGSQSVNYANSAGNADKLDGIHANGLLTALSNSNNGISITVGGTTKSVSNISVNYASSAGSATKVIVNLHTTNDTNYPLVWSNLSNTNSVTENQLYKSWSDLYYNPKNKRLTVGGSVVASSFVKRGGTSLQLLRADGGIAAFNWSGQSGLPSWLWGGNNEHSYYVYNPSNFRVAYATSSGNADTLDGEHAKGFVRAGHYESADLNKLDTYSFIRSVNSQVSSTSPKGDIGWYNVILLVHRNGDDDGPNYIGLIALGMTSNVNDIFFRCRRTDPWKTIIHSNNYTEFINNYYWANVKISTSSSTTTSPTVSNLTATSSIRMGNIYLLNTNEINSTSGIHLNYQNSGNISLCYGGGSVGIGTTSPTYKLDVNGLMRASGFHHSSMNSDNYILLAGGGYKSFGGDSSHPVFLGYLNLDHGSDGTVSSSFSCLGYTVPFTYTRGGNYCKISIPDTTHQAFYIKAATASVNYSGGGMDTWTGNHRGAGAWWLHCYAPSSNEVRVKGFHLKDTNNDSWWGGNPLWSDRSGVNRITVCIFGYVTFR